MKKFLSGTCIRELAAEGNANLAEYLIAQAGNRKEAVCAVLTGAARGLNGGYNRR